MATLPHKPDYLSSDEWKYVLSTYGRTCALRPQCIATGKLSADADCCSDDLDIDHLHPKALGGDDGFANIRPLCLQENRSRPLIPDPRWVAHNFWDKPFDSDRLRQIQFLSAFDPILGPDLAGFASSGRNALLKTTTLLVGATGIGKTLSMAAALFAFNQSVNAVGPARPRVKSVLWLAVDRTLREQAVVELQKEMVKLELVDAEPRVRPAKSYNDLLRGPNGFDVTVSCPQSLWEDDDGKDKNESLSPREIRDAIGHFDTIIFDECDWANERVQEICLAATHALKFSMTASPPIMEGSDPKSKASFLRRSVLISDTAVGDYTRAVKLDGCLKELRNPLYVAVAGHGSLERFSRGHREEFEGQLSEPEHVLYRAAVLDAVVVADRLERDMKRDYPEHWFSPHVLVRVPRISELRALCATLANDLHELRRSGEIEGEGWESTPIWAGHARYVPSAERDLSRHTHADGYVHPFMRSKNTDGRVAKGQGCKRILLMSQIGIRGINNWPITAVVDCTSNVSLTEMTQIVGRPIRWPNHLAALRHDRGFRRYLTASVYVPETLLTDEKKACLEEVRDFIENMREQVSGAGFLTWSDLAGGTDIEQADPDIGPGSQPLTKVDKLHIMNALGAVLAQGGDLSPAESPRVLEKIVQGLVPPASPRRAERAIDYGFRLLGKPDFRRRECFGSLDPDKPLRIVDCTARLRPKASYKPEELIRYVQHDPRYTEDRAQIIDALQSDNPLIAKLISDNLRKEQRSLYREPGKTYRLNDKDGEAGVLTELQNALCQRLIKSGALDPALRGEVFPAGHAAAQALFGVEDSKNDGPLDEHAYHVAIMGRYQEEIMDMATAILCRRGVLSNINKLGSHDAR